MYVETQFECEYFQVWYIGVIYDRIICSKTSFKGLALIFERSERGPDSYTI